MSAEIYIYIYIDINTNYSDWRVGSRVFTWLVVVLAFHLIMIGKCWLRAVDESGVS